MTLRKEDTTEGRRRRAARSDLRDARSGAHDNVAPPPKRPMDEQQTAHQQAQPGADVRAKTEAADESAPEGLRRARKGPYGRTTGRATEKATPELGTHAERDVHVEGRRR